MSTKASYGTAPVPTVSPPSAGATRVAVIQLAYHPAALREDKASSPLEDPLFSLKRGDSLIPGAGWLAPEPLREELKALRHRIRAVYCDQLRRRLVAVLEACSGMGVQIAVLPEYSVPFDLLEAIAAVAPGMVVVAGTHSVERAALKKNTAVGAPQDAPALDVYQRLGASAAPRLLESVCPVLHGGRVVALQPKLNPALPERDFMRRGERWHPVSLPEPLRGPMGVLICLDFLYRESPAYREHVAAQLDGCSFIAVPSLTPHYSLPEFSGQATMEARRRGKPVLYCNTTEEGGTSIYIDEKENARPFPEGPGALQREDEGLIIADLRLDLVPRGKSTRHDEPRLLTPIAAAGLVYRARPREREYAAWVEELHRKASVDDELDALETITAHVHEAEALLRDVGQGGMRRARLTRLQEEIDCAAGVDRVQQLAREVLLPPDVLPLQAVRAAMALGAADVVRWWRERSGPEAAELADVERRLRGESGAATWSGEQALLAEGRRAFEEIVRVVRGEAPAHREREVLVAQVQAYAGAAKEGFDAKQQEAQAAFDAGRFEEARALFQKMLVTAEGLVEKDPDEAELRRRVARCQLNVAACSLNLQEVESAAEVLRRLDAAYLSTRGRITLAECLAYTGELEAARLVLPDGDQAESLEDGERLIKVRQILTLRAGEMPAGELLPNSTVQLEAAELLLERDDLDGAAQHALRAMAGAEAQAPLTRARALSILVAALKQSIHEQPPTARFIDAELMSQVVTRIGEGLETMPFEALPKTIRRELRGWQRLYYGLVYDRTALDALKTVEDGAADQAEAFPGGQNGEAHATQLAAEGWLEDALAAPPPIEHPWLGRWHRALQMAMAGRKERARAEVLDLAREMPGKAPVEFVVADLLGREGRHREALDHAELAFAALPGKGQRCLLAWCLLDTQQTAQAWEILRPLLRSDEPGILVLLAQAAEVGEPGEAPALWARYLKHRPRDGTARVRRALALHRIGEREQAAEVAWEALQDHGDDLDPEAISTAAKLQVLHGRELGEHIRERLQKGAGLLHRRFPGDPEAEFFRLQLLSLFLEPAGVQPVDWALLQGAGFVVEIPTEELTENLRRDHERTEHAYWLYQMGVLPFATMRDLTGCDTPTLFLRIIHRAQAEGGVLCAPVAPDVSTPLFSIRDASLMVSDLELYLLQHLGLLPRLREALGGRGRLLIPVETERRLHQESASLQATVGLVQARLRSCELALRTAARMPRYEPGLSLCDVRAVPEGTIRLSPRGLAQQLFSAGRITRERLNALEANLPPDDTKVWPESAPERFGVTAEVLLRFAEADALEALQEAFPAKILVDPEAPAALVLRRDGFAAELDRAHLADQVARFVAQGQRDGWLILLDPPTTVPDLPALSENASGAASMLREPLRALLSLRAMQERHPDLCRVTADFFGRSALGHPVQVRSLAWPSLDAYFALSQWNRRIAGRDLHLPAMVRLLMPDSRADEKLIQLAGLGFPDALGAGELIRMARDYGGLTKAKPQRVLDQMEWLAREPGHLGGEMARLQLAQVYAIAVWAAFCGDDLPPEQRIPIPHVDASATSVLKEAEAVVFCSNILARTEEIDNRIGSAILDQLLTFAVGLAPGLTRSFTIKEDETVVLDEQSRGASVWRFLYTSWAKGNRDREGALGRAVRQVLALLDLARQSGPPMPELGPLTLLMGQGSHTGAPHVTLRTPEAEAAAILSAHWSEQPLSSRTVKVTFTTSGRQIQEAVDMQDLVAHGVSLLEASLREGPTTEIFHGDERLWRYPYPLRELTNRSIMVEVPFEALFLRIAPELVPQVAHHGATLQGPNDGRAYSMLMALAQAPEDIDSRRRYARFSVSAPWRLVRDNPSFLLRWPARRSGDEMRIPHLEDLRNMLSEPTGSLRAEQPVGDIIAERVQKDGIWEKRLDVHALYFQTSEIPGSLPAATLGSRLADDVYAQEVEVALHRLDHPHEHPVARLAGDLYFLSIAAANKPQVQLSAGPVDLNHELTDRVLRLLNQVIEAPPQDTLAEAEGALLRVCRLVVARLQRTEPLPPRDHLWLTYRLFQWLCAQLAAISPDARREGMRRLVQEAPAPSEEVQDLLDPSHFDRNLFDHRLATVLYALAAMEELARHARTQGDGAEEPPAAISSAALEHRLAELAARPRRGHRARSDLDWNAPAEIPDLALIALLRRDPKGLLALTPDARQRWLEVIPAAPESLEKAELELVRSIVINAADNAAALAPTERAVYEEKLRCMDDSPTSRKLRWIGLGSLFSPAAPHLEEDARALLLAHMDDPLAPLLCGRFLSALSAIDLQRLEQEVNVLLASAAERSEAGPGVVFVGLARVAFAGPTEARAPARDLLARLAARPELRQDADLLQILRLLNIPEPTS